VPNLLNDQGDAYTDQLAWLWRAPVARAWSRAQISVVPLPLALLLEGAQDTQDVYEYWAITRTSQGWAERPRSENQLAHSRVPAKETWVEAECKDGARINQIVYTLAWARLPFSGAQEHLNLWIKAGFCELVRSRWSEQSLLWSLSRNWSETGPISN
jgi:hypothetical protein